MESLGPKPEREGLKEAENGISIDAGTDAVDQL